MLCCNHQSFEKGFLEHTRYDVKSYAALFEIEHGFSCNKCNKGSSNNNENKMCIHITILRLLLCKTL